MSDLNALQPGAKQTTDASRLFKTAGETTRLGSAASNGIFAHSRGAETSATVSLPPLRRSGEVVEAGPIASTNCCSPMRRARKAELMAYAMGRNPNSAGSSLSGGMLLELDATQHQLVAAAGQQEDLGRVALETWVDDMLKHSQAAAKQQQPTSPQIQQLAESAGGKGAAAVGLARQQLLATGMSGAAVDQLYRSFFVYTVGFFDTVKEVLAHNGHRQELLYTIWRTYMTLSEQTMKATFKSEYVALVEAAGTAMAELMSSKHALAEARRDNAVMVKDLGWLSAAEAEAAAARRGLKSQVEDLQSGLSVEQKAHQHAVKQYVDALDAKSQLQLQYHDAHQQLNLLRAEHDELQQQYEQLQGQYGRLVGQCKVVRDVCKTVDHALALDSQLAQSIQHQEQQQQEPQQQQQQEHQQHNDLDQMPSSEPPSGSTLDGAAACSDCDTTMQPQQQQQQLGKPSVQADASGAADQVAEVDDATDLQPLAERLQQQVQLIHFQWRSALDARAVALTEKFRLGDELRAAKEETYQKGQQLQGLQKSHDRIEVQLSRSQAAAADLEKRLLAAHEAIARHLLDLGECEGHLQHSRNKAASLEQRCAQLEDNLRDVRDDLAAQVKDCKKLEHHLQASGDQLTRKHRLMAEVSKGLSIAMQSLWAQQTGRGVLRRLLDAERQKGAHLGSSLEGKDARLHDLDATVQEQQGRIARLQAEVSLLETGLAESQKQAMALGARFTLSDTKNEELLNQIQGLQDQIKEATTRFNKATTKLEVTQGQLDKATREVKDLREAAQVAERELANGRLTAKSLTAEVERLTREKKDLGDRAEATKARLGLDIQRLSGELHAAEHKLELLTADLVAERDRVAATQALHERKRGKKRRWKSAYTVAVSEAESLHMQLLSKQKELEVLETRIKRLETELRILGAANTVRLPAAAAGTPGQGANRPPSAHSVSIVNLASARKAHEDAAMHVNNLGQECLALDDGIEELELEQQKLLLQLATPDVTTEQMATIRSAAAAKLVDLKQLRSQRSEVEAKRGAAAEGMRAAESALREAHQQRLLQRQRLLEQQALQTSDLMNAAALNQLAAAEASEVASRNQLSKQLAAFEAAQADKAAMSQRMEALQAGIDKFMVRITDLQGEKAQLEEKLQRANTVVNFLQVEISQLKTERERIKGHVYDSEGRIAALEDELEKAKQSVSVALKGLEAKHQADKIIQEQKQLADRAKAAQSAKAQEAALAALRCQCNQLQDSLQWMAAEAWALKMGTRHPFKPDVHGCSDQNGCGSGNNSMAGFGVGSNDAVQPVAASINSSSSGGNAGSKPVCIALSDTGAGGGAGVLGVRWLYQHQTSGPWATARAALRDGAAAAAAAVAAGGLTPRPELTPEGIRHLGGPTALPCGLPGLGFKPDNLAVLIGELMLDKIASDIAADAQLASTAMTSSSGGAGQEGEESGGTAKGAAAVKVWWAARNRKDLEGSVYDFFMSRLGCRLATESHCSALVASLRKSSARSTRARLFGRCLGVVEPAVPAQGVNTLIHLMAQLHSLCGPLTGEATEGCSQVLARTAVQVVTDLLSPTLASACQELSGLPKAIVDAAGGHSDNAVEVDDLLELVLDVWLAQQAADQRQFEALFRLVDVHGRGLTLQDEFVGLVKQVNAGVAAALSPEQFNTLFISALRASGPGTAAVNAAGCAAVLMGAGLIGCAAHLRNHPAVTSKPPFSEYRLLEDSWHAIKPAMQELLRTLPRRSPQLAPEVSAMTAQIKKLDDSLEGCAPAAELWQCYGKILGFYSHHGKFVEVTPAATGSLTADTVCNSPRGPAAAATPEDVNGGDTESTAGAVTGYQSNLPSSSSSSRPSSPLGQLTPLPLVSVGARGPGMPASPWLLAVAVGSRPGSADSAAASAATSVPCSPVHTVAVPTAAPGSRPGSAGGPGLKLPLAAALVRPGSALSRPGLSPRGSASSLSGLRSK